ncbi:putative AB5 enterotoxin ADP-ribosylating subunit YtxA [Yersinia canariae]|uniref:Putative AB5 enterotoxin ADP-ribosylating subunit YtxA n=1 Tax=Yersinia canariae TaxID=2607663 RepID=A0A857F1C3_9GAMM|nr:putative AB5 enterotoxin ADP-ribosylating subunit YtxA [Yersinia canariae]QHB32549.1 putative AB5 enterotoxin ADP-ribosylating subunit YtxA [Yersinia canariae]
MILIKAILLYLISILLSYECEAKPPDIVWRVDARDHHDVFNHGFVAAGNNHNVADHLSGESCRKSRKMEGSAFIATTANRSFAYDYAERVLKNLAKQGSQNAKIYIYQIRAAENMYSAEDTLIFLLQGNNSFKNRSGFRMIYRLPYLSEWMAHRRIGAEQVAVGMAYHIDGGVMRSDAYLSNPGFVQTRSHANNRPYPVVFSGKSTMQIPRTWMLRLGVNPMINACFGRLDFTYSNTGIHEQHLGHQGFLLANILLI